MERKEGECLDVLVTIMNIHASVLCKGNIAFRYLHEMSCALRYNLLQVWDPPSGIQSPISPDQDWITLQMASEVGGGGGGEVEIEKLIPSSFFSLTMTALS